MTPPPPNPSRRSPRVRSATTNMRETGAVGAYLQQKTLRKHERGQASTNSGTPNIKKHYVPLWLRFDFRAWFLLFAAVARDASEFGVTRFVFRVSLG